MSGTRDFMVGVLVGSAVGAAAALLYAPMTGAETRQRIREKSGEAKERTLELAQQARGRASELAGQAQGRISELKTQAKSKVGEISHQAQSTIDRGRGVLEQQKEAIKTAVEAGKQAYVEKQSELKKEVEADTAPVATSAV
jgi:gas vesicle protein